MSDTHMVQAGTAMVDADVVRMDLGFSEPAVYQLLLRDSPPAAADVACLSAAEIARADRLRAGKVRSRFIRCRAALRRVLAGWLGGTAAGVPLRETDTGRPFVPGADLDFNVTHSADLALIAVLPGTGSVGVDVERVVEVPDLLGLARTVCTARELELMPEDPGGQLQSFYRLWTCKEAVLKGVGSGLSADPRRVEIGVVTSVRGLSRHAPDGRGFRITTFDPRPGFAAALAVSTER